MKEYIIELSLADIRKLDLQARKSPEKKVRFIIKVPDKIKTIAYDNTKGVKGPVTESPIPIDQTTQTPETSFD